MNEDGMVWLGDLSGWEVAPHGIDDEKLGVLFHRCGYEREIAQDGFTGKYVGNIVALVLEDGHDCREYTL